MSENVLHVGRKSIVAYIRSAIASCIGLLIFGGATFAAAFAGAPLLAVVGAGVCLLVAATGIYNLLYLRTVLWIVADEGVRVKSGLLPWRKTDFNHPYETIFESYFKFGFFAKLLGYGAVTLRRTEGITTAESFLMMHDPSKVTRLINDKLKELRKAQIPSATAPAVAPAAPGAVQQLTELAQLMSAGHISVEDFQLLKAKILGKPAVHATPSPEPNPESDSFAS